MVNTFVVFLSRVVGYVVHSSLVLYQMKEISGPGIGYMVTSMICEWCLRAGQCHRGMVFNETPVPGPMLGAATTGMLVPMQTHCVVWAACILSRCRKTWRLPGSQAGRCDGLVRHASARLENELLRCQ